MGSIKINVPFSQELHDSQEYLRKRKAEYDALNQFEIQYDDDVNGTTTWKDAIT